ncbi:MAG TPA: UDP-glucose/GDP-mannose dehydrogenase family protein [Saprospiraceae bacterium]|nr:UDP-glucose/GDP-mannose dehydrogenase family protein [Saprospiraceae bacterium]
MNITIVGTGYVGLVSGTCFAELGSNVTCIDVNQEKIENLKKGIIPIYEPGLESMINKNVNAGRLHFNTKLEDVVNESEIIFIAVGTPSDEDGSADLKYVIDVARSIGKSINKYLVVVVKSTVPVGTSKKVKQAIQEELDKRNVEVEFDVASNPEFLKEGDAIDDFMKPDRVVIGVETEKAKAFMTKLYQPILLNNFRVIFMDIPSAEMTKYAANAMLATRISFMNDIANLSELVGADVNMVRRGIGSDTRIGNKFLYPGCGYGGSCFPKDVKALIKTAKDNGYNLRVLNAVEEVNELQKNVLFKKFKQHYNGETSGKKVAIWGLSFKPGTDDMREAPSLVLIEQLLNDGCDVTVYDPVAMHECKRIIGDKVNYAKDLYDSVLDAEVIFHVTEWKEFRMPNWEVIKRSMKQAPLIIDGRNVFNQETLVGFNYLGIGF